MFKFSVEKFLQIEQLLEIAVSDWRGFVREKNSKAALALNDSLLAVEAAVNEEVRDTRISRAATHAVLFDIILSGSKKLEQLEDEINAIAGLVDQYSPDEPVPAAEWWLFKQKMAEESLRDRKIPLALA